MIGGIMWSQSLPIASYSHAQPFFNLGVGLSRIGKPAEARQAYLDALKLSPDYDPALVNLGKLAWSSGHHTDAVSWWEKALKLNPDAVEAHSNLGAYKASCGDMLSARAHFKHAVGVQPYYFLGWLHLAQAEQALGNYHEALIDFENALELTADHPQALYGRAVCHDALHHPETLKAWEDYIRAAKPIAEELPFVFQAEQRINELISMNQGS